MTACSIAQCIAYWTRRKPEAVAITDSDAEISWSELDRQTTRLAQALSEKGVAQGDIVTLALPNGIDFYRSAIAVWKIGATPHPLAVKSPALEREAILDVVKPKLVISEGDPDCLHAAAKSDHLPADVVPVHWKAIGSGGSTGQPKIIVSKFPGLFDPMAPDFRMETEDVMLAPGPLYHNASFMFSMRSLFCGGHVVVMNRFNAEEALSLIAKHRVQWAVMVPTMMHRIWQLPPGVREKFDLSSLRILFHTGAPCPPWLKENWISWLGPDVIHEGYGGTEGCGGHWITGAEWLDRKGSVGQTQDAFEIQIRGPTGDVLPVGEIGEVFSRPFSGPGSTYFYLGAESRRTEDGFESIGDMGHLDSEGFLFLADRRTDLVISGGANIYPAEVEAAIDSFPGVVSSAVVGLPDNDLGARLHAIVESEVNLNLDDLAEHLSLRLPRYKIPRSIENVHTPLRNEAGKVRRSELREARLNRSV